MDPDERILKTVAYFDLFDYPLTRAEVRRWLFGVGAVLFNDVDQAITQLVVSGVLKEENGFVYAFDREGLPAVREERFRHSARKWKRARRWARVFAGVPGIELVGVGNTLAYHNAKDGSDIDFFIVTRPGTIWRSRIICAFMAAAFNLRPRAGDSRDKLCLSFFVTEEALDIARHCERERSNLMGDTPMTDIYLHYWIRQMVPLFGSEKIMDDFCAANGGLTERGIPSKAGIWSRLFAPFKWLPGDFLKRTQEWRFPAILRQAESRHDGSVIISDNILKFHVNDRRAEVYDKWVKRSEYLMSNDVRRIRY